ncbi:Aminopeptidase Q [Myotis davidii]|uniref:Aminopeptidase Q n=1 Tax=Myotis davidii TaxID=225400 RepID=L5MD36_MYODS|nr:Aminopeptidase Q [Myotis davidii]
MSNCRVRPTFHQSDILSTAQLLVERIDHQGPAPVLSVCPLVNEVFFSNLLHDVLREDHSLLSRAVSMKVENFTEINEISELFDIFTYNKGASMVRMLSSFLSENLFISALKSYLETFSYSNAKQDDLWRHFQMAIDDQSKIVLPATVKSIMDSWTYQSGFPVITLNVSTGVMKQEPFYLGKVKNQTLLTHNDTWIVPVLWMKNGITQSLVWLDKSSKLFPEMQISNFDHDWVILNLNMTGYYRVNYDKLGWKKLNQQLEKDHKAIPVIHRLQLIDDAFSLSKNNYIEIETALDLTKYLAEEDEIIVWHTVLVNLLPSNFVSDVGNYDTYTLLKLCLAKHFPTLISILLLCRYGIHSLVTIMYLIGRTISTDLQVMELQQFFNPMLEEHQRLEVHAKLQAIKNENLTNKNQSAGIAAWLRKNT